MGMRSADIAAIHAKLKEEGLCSPKMLLDCAGWGNDENPNGRLADIMDYLVGIGVAEKAPEGWQALDAMGRPVKRKSAIPLPRARHPEQSEAAEKKKLGRKRVPHDAKKAADILAKVREGRSLNDACILADISVGLLKKWRRASRELDAEFTAAIRIAGNSPSLKSREKRKSIQELLAKGYSHKAIVKLLKCSKHTVIRAKESE